MMSFISYFMMSLFWYSPIKFHEFMTPFGWSYKAYKASVFAIRSPKAKCTRGNKKGKDPVEIDGRILEYYVYK